MSLNPLTALRALRDRQDLTPGEFSVMVAIVLRSDPTGCMWASQKLIGRDCKLSDRSVREKMASLMEKGLISRVKRPGTSDYCMINVTELTAEISSAPVLTLAESSAPPGNIFRTPRKNLPDTPENTSANLPKEIPKDLPKDLPTKKEPQIKTESVYPLWSSSWWTELWIELNQEIGRSKPLKLTKKRKEAIKARLLEHGESVLFDVVRWYQNSQHPRAVFLRSNGYTIDTVLQRSKFDQYATMAEMPEGTVIEKDDPLAILGAARKLRLEEGT